MATTTEQTIRLLNDQAIEHLTKERYNNAETVLRSCVEQFFPKRLSRLHARVLPLSSFEKTREQSGNSLPTTPVTLLYPLPTAIMAPPTDATRNLFRECFMLWMEEQAVTVDDVFPVNHHHRGLGDDDDDELRETALSDKSASLCSTVLLFNLGLVHHLRGLSKTHAQPGDMERAEECYRLAIASSWELTTTTSRTSHHHQHQHAHQGAMAANVTACWLLVLAIANNLGCIACEAGNCDVVQECLSLGQDAMAHINLPLFWSNQFTWCSPSAAA